MSEAAGWYRLKQLGEGGQSTVYLVRNPERSQKLESASLRIAHTLTVPFEVDSFVDALSERMRADRKDELGALKVFDKVRDGGAAPENRIKREIEILGEGYEGLPKLLASNADEKWMVTEFFPEGSLDKSPKIFQGDPMRALKAFRTLVKTVAHLHRTGIVHRDIKPANIFIDSDKLVAGDFGIAFTNDAANRITVTHERVGPWDYMPQWADTGERFEEVSPSFDVYMLGKLLWCMVSGQLRLPREYHRRKEFDLQQRFPKVAEIELVNQILDRCLVEHESDCLTSAVELLKLTDDFIASSRSNIKINERGGAEMSCFMCGRGSYVEEAAGGGPFLPMSSNNSIQEPSILVRSFSCNVCTHKAFFAPNFPQEAAKRQWRKL